MEKIDKIRYQLYTLIYSIRDCVGSYNLYTNITYLLFLKFIVNYSDRLEIKDIETYKILGAFKRKYDNARAGMEYLSVEDIRVVLNALDNEPAYQNYYFKDALSSYAKLIGDRKAQQNIFKSLDSFEFEKEISLSDFFELIIQTCSNDISKTCEYITDESIRDLAEALLDVNKDDDFLDCFSGFATTLLGVKDYKSFLGFEINVETALVSRLNLLMQQKNNWKVMTEDFFYANTNEIATKLFSDGPIGAKGEYPVLCKEYGIDTKELELLALLKEFHSLKNGGRAVITEPGKILFSVAKGYVSSRKYITQCGLKAVIMLPPLWSQAAINTNMLVLEKGYAGDVCFIDGRKLGVSIRKKTKLREEDIKRITAAINEHHEEKGFSSFKSAKEILKEENCTWLPTRYVESLEEYKYRAIEEIDLELNQLYGKLIEGIKK